MERRWVDINEQLPETDDNGNGVETYYMGLINNYKHPTRKGDYLTTWPVKYIEEKWYMYRSNTHELVNDEHFKLIGWAMPLEPNCKSAHDILADHKNLNS